MGYAEIINRYLPDGAAPAVIGDLIVYEIPPGDILPACRELYRRHGLPLKTITAFDERAESGFFRIMYVFGVPGENVFLAPYILVSDKLPEFPSLTPRIHEASKYERKLFSLFGLKPVGNPDTRPLHLHENWPRGRFPMRKDHPWNERPATAHGDSYKFVKIGGEGIYEIPVGPVHAGIIEPGHFRFSMAGEEILMLEPRFGYSHKGSEKLFEQLDLPGKVRLAERISGDSSFSHALAFCQAVEKLGGLTVPEPAALARVVYCELERLANHFGDAGAIMTDTGFNFGGAHGFRLREQVMQLCERLTGSRFLRGVAAPGGVSGGIAGAAARELLTELAALEIDFSQIMSVAENSNSLMNRMVDAGVLLHEHARAHGVVGVAARASGISMDARTDYPYAGYGGMKIAEVVEESGDVQARFRVRVREVFSSMDILRQALTQLAAVEPGSADWMVSGATDRTPGGAAAAEPQLEAGSFAVSVVEGWRGEIVYVVATGADGQISRVEVRDPSFRNWTALRYAARENMIPDFPLINKSFNLSYSGNDL